MPSLSSRRGMAVLLALALVGAAMTLSSGAVVTADHGCIDARWPAFRKVAPTAKRIIVGTVTESTRDIGDTANVRQYGLSDPWDSFRLRVDEVLRGTARGSIEISRLRSGLPLTDPRPECGRLKAKVGDRIALALRGKLDGARGRISTVAWIEGQPGISGQRAQRLTIGQVRRISGHAADGSTLPPDRGIRRVSVSLAALPGLLEEGIDDILRSVADVQAGDRCTSILGQLPDVQSGSPARLIAGYRMSGQELAAYSERLWTLGPIVERESQAYATPLDVCIFDGSFTRTGSGRMLVLLGSAGSPVRGFAVCDKNEIPLDYDRPDPIPWPEATENWC